MNIFTVLAYGIGLSMDAFAVSICKGTALVKARTVDALKVGLYFGVFQGLMPLIGYFLANSFSSYIEEYDHWIAFGLLLFIGAKMVYESSHPECDKDDNKALSFGNMIVMSVATSVDALAVGIAFSCDGMGIHSDGFIMGIISSCIIICCTTLILSALGVKLGKFLECKIKKGAEITGGIVLILLGVKILIEHLTGFSILGI